VNLPEWEDTMAQFHHLYQLMRADFYERTRRYSFLITMGLVIATAYFYLPTSGMRSFSLALDDYRGVYNSAWVGSAVAALCLMLLSLPGFYLVKNAIDRDERTRVGQILATTPISKPLYTLAKAFSNFVFLAVMVGTIALAAAGMQMIRGEDYHLDLWALCSPFVFCVLPAMALIAAMAILFESIGWLRGTLGNVVYFFLWLGMLAASTPSSSAQTGVPAVDAFGLLVISSNMVRDAAAIIPNYTGSFMLGGAPMQTFRWEGIHWTSGIILGRMMWLGAAIGLSLVAAIFFRRFDPSRARIKRAREAAVPQPGEPAGSPEREEPVVPAGPVSLTPVASRFRPRRGALLLAEARILLKGTPWWWYLVALGLIIAGLTVPTDVLRWMLIVAWLWPLALWSSMGCREARHHTQQLVFSAPDLLGRQLPAVWLTGVLATIAAGSGVAIRLGLAGDWMHLVAWGTAALFIPSLALALGVWSSSNKLFEVVYMVLWYVGPVNQTPSLDFMGTGAQVSLGVLSIYWIGTVVLLGLAVLGRRRQALM
jgi:hypothetical protein